MSILLRIVRYNQILTTYVAFWSKNHGDFIFCNCMKIHRILKFCFSYINKYIWLHMLLSRIMNFMYALLQHCVITRTNCIKPNFLTVAPYSTCTFINSFLTSNSFFLNYYSLISKYYYRKTKPLLNLQHHKYVWKISNSLICTFSIHHRLRYPAG